MRAKKKKQREAKKVNREDTPVAKCTGIKARRNGAKKGECHGKVREIKAAV
jgi:hypothetical protein